jgi:hypothetical protein
MNIFKTNLLCLRAGASLVLLMATRAGAQNIMSFEDYQALDHVEPYVYQLDTEKGSLLYFGSRHSFLPSDPQMEALSRAWTSFRPQMAFTEGGELSIDSLTKEQIIQRYGEFGMTWWLARRDSVQVRSLDPDRKAEVAHLQGRGWTGEQLMLFFTLRKVAQSQEQLVNVDLAEVLPQYLQSMVHRFGLKGPTNIKEFEKAVKRLLPSLENWRTISMSYFYPGPQDPSYFTNQIATDSNHFRDQYQVKLLLEAVDGGKRVFAIAGSAHAVMQEPALRAALKSQE